MSGELQFSLPALSGQKLRAVLWDSAGRVRNTATSAFESWVNGNIADYDIVMTEEGSSGRWLGNMPVVAAGTYSYDIRLPADQSDPVVLALTDPVVGSGSVEWSGTAAVSAAVMMAALTEDSGGLRFTAHALEEAPGAGDISAIYDILTEVEETLEARTIYATGSEPPGNAALSIRCGDTIAVEIGGLASLVSGWDSIWVTIKKAPNQPDSEAILQVRVDAAGAPGPGLERVNGLSPEDAEIDANTASITDVNTANKTVILRLTPALSRMLSPDNELWWDAQMLKDGDITTLTTGARSARIHVDVTQAIE